MSNDIDQFRKDLTELGARINAKIEEFHERGVLHGAERQEAAEFEIQHASALKSAHHVGVGGAIAEELATDGWTTGDGYGS